MQALNSGFVGRARPPVDLAPLSVEGAEVALPLPMRSGLCTCA